MQVGQVRAARRIGRLVQTIGTAGLTSKRSSVDWYQLDLEKPPL